MLSKNTVKDKLALGRPVLGTWSIIPSPVVADIISSTGLDFIVIDGEHGPASFETAQSMTIACESRGVSPILRVGGVNEDAILKALDIGVHGIHVPNVNTQNAVQKVIEYAKYPPLGNRGFSPFTRAGNYCRNADATFTTSANDNTLVVIHIEGKEALEDLDGILAVPGLDVVFVGLFDLSKALGKPGQVNDPEVLSYLEMLTARIRSAGKYAGTIAVSLDHVRQFSGMGVQYFTYLVDCDMLRYAYQEVVQEFANLH